MTPAGVALALHMLAALTAAGVCQPDGQGWTCDAPKVDLAGVRGLPVLRRGARPGCGRPN